MNINYILIYVNKDLTGLFTDLCAGLGHTGDIPERIMRKTFSQGFCPD